MITSRRRIVAPTTPVVTLAEMYLQCRLDTEGSPPTHPEDTLLQQYVAAATAELEGGDDGDGWLGRSLMPQTWRITCDGFPCADDANPYAELRLPFPPLMSVDSLTYVNNAGETVTMTEGTDYVVDLDGDPCGSIRPVFRGLWPTTGDVPRSVAIVFTAGYNADASPPMTVPAIIKQAIQMRAGTMYAQREDVALNINVQPIGDWVAPIKAFRVYGP